MHIIHQNNYPTFSLPDSIRSAAIELAVNVQVTDIIAATSCLTTLSICVSPLTDWRHPLSGQVRPCVLNQAIAAISGDRKSSAEMLACRPIYEHDADAIVQHELNLRGYRRATLRWNAVRSRLLRNYAKHVLDGDSSAAEAELAAFEEQETVKPITHRVIHDGGSQVTAFEALEGNGKAVALLTDEGQTLLSSTVMRHYGFLNNLWDGKALLTHSRAEHNNLIVQNPRMTISFMIQPEVLAEFFVKRGKAVHASGFWARFLFSRSPTLQGRRKPTLSAPLVHLLPFHARIRELMSLYKTMLFSGQIQRDVLEFDEEAKFMWLQMATKVESEFLPGYFLSDISDFGNKYMDIVGRLACLFHYFGANIVDLPASSEARVASLGKISAATLACAQEVAAWHLNEYKQTFAPPLQRTPEEHDADRVYAYLYRSIHVPGIGTVLKNHVRQYCGVRSTTRLNNALQLLQQWQAIGSSRTKVGNSKKESEVILLNPQYFNSRPLY